MTQTESGRFVLCQGERSSGQDEVPAHHIGSSPQENRGGAAGTVGEGESREEVGN